MTACSAISAELVGDFDVGVAPQRDGFSLLVVGVVGVVRGQVAQRRLGDWTRTKFS
jgi:hypothetical protein